MGCMRCGVMRCDFESAFSKMRMCEADSTEVAKAELKHFASNIESLPLAKCSDYVKRSSITLARLPISKIPKRKWAKTFFHVLTLTLQKYTSKSLKTVWRWYHSPPKQKRTYSFHRKSFKFLVGMRRFELPTP